MAERLFDHLPQIEDQLRSSSRWIVGLDFDGTLAPIVENPAEAMLEPRLRASLAALAARPNQPTVIMSGRARLDVESLVGMSGLIYAGNHGLDIVCGPLRLIEPTAAVSQPALDAMAETMSNRLAAIPGILVEHKGLTLSVHYRMVEDGLHEEVRRLIHAVLASTDHPFVLTTGKRVFEIRPRTYWNKGTAMNWIKEQIAPDARILYVGDDRTDEDAFRVCPDGVSIRVGPSPDTVASYFLDTQADVHALLEWLVPRL